MSVEVTVLLQRMITGVMAIQVDNETGCGRDAAIAAIQEVMLGDYGLDEPSAVGTFNIVKLAVQIAKKGRDNEQNFLDPSNP